MVCRFPATRWRTALITPSIMEVVLIGRHSIKHLLAPVNSVDQFGSLLPFRGVAATAFARVVLVDGVAITVLNASIALA